MHVVYQRLIAVVALLILIKAPLPLRRSGSSSSSMAAAVAAGSPSKRARTEAAAGRPRALILATGGTVDKAYPRLTGGWAFEIGEPAAGRILERVTPPGFDYSVQSVCAKDSQEITDDDRTKLLASCESADCDWIVVTHGTDTMIETAQFLGRRQREEGSKLASKRICLTGSMRPERFVDTDAHFNLGVCFGALSLASPGVYVCMNGRVHSWDAVVRDLESGAFSPLTN
eukprot:TRINITY_DN11149_c0_g1_i1.p1 TRINITY_DN11149_c0_g1~~TRINITY_DN11149_c0_g1_i1.p1  ORF type:complete len:229 (+),score=36.97 TRINITY_DN11149_c0_g1_i1:37-723(+)